MFTVLNRIHMSGMISDIVMATAIQAMETAATAETQAGVIPEAMEVEVVVAADAAEAVEAAAEARYWLSLAAWQQDESVADKMLHHVKRCSYWTDRNRRCFDLLPVAGSQGPGSGATLSEVPEVIQLRNFLRNNSTFRQLTTG